ncbi:hypothetical protein LX32DRAFT_222872 [Colletotrichum zoysiae]|uniref:Uncharacterized protein n=1 Tax=Colletotrichum zoysiae TaxID=1216348 RepID=A0AAD9H3S3_9PEZI|nr:hypothetical protein LX32DRAFT_222872 [Colletotrichum zoysiae]
MPAARLASYIQSCRALFLFSHARRHHHHHHRHHQASRNALIAAFCHHLVPPDYPISGFRCPWMLLYTHAHAMSLSGHTTCTLTHPRHTIHEVESNRIVLLRPLPQPRCVGKTLTITSIPAFPAMGKHPFYRN